MPARSMIRTADTRMTAAKAGVGRYAIGPVRKSSTANTTAAATRPVSCVREPAASDAPVRDGLALIG